MDQSRQYTLIVGPYVDVEDEEHCASCAQRLVAGEIVVTLVDGPLNEFTSGVNISLLHGRCAAPLVARLVQGEEVWP